MAIQLTNLEKLLLPAFLVLFEVVFIIVYGLVVDYDEGGSPDHEQEVALQLLQNNATAEEYVLKLASTRGTTKFYPCESKTSFALVIMIIFLRLQYLDL